MRFAPAFLLVALLAASGAGQSVYVPDANAAGGPCSNQPLNYGVSWRYLYIVSQKTLGHRPLKILDVAFAPCNTTLFTAARFQMRMAHTTATVTGPGCFDTLLGATPIVVYDGPLEWNATRDTWCPLGLRTSFGYDGHRNLAIEFRFRGGSAGGGQGSRDGVNLRIDPGALSLTVDPGMSADPYTEKCGNQIRGFPRTALRYDTVNLLAGYDQVHVGGRTTYLITGRSREGYQLAASFGQGPLPLGSYTLGLDVDPLFVASLTVGAPVFYQYGGILSFSGIAAPSISVPKLPALAGTRIYHAAVTYTTSITGTTNTVGTLIVP
jgi:hypothetical protein